MEYLQLQYLKWKVNKFYFKFSPDDDFENNYLIFDLIEPQQ